MSEPGTFFPPTAMAWATVSGDVVQVRLTWWQGEITVRLFRESAVELARQLEVAVGELDNTVAHGPPSPSEQFVAQSSGRRCEWCNGPVLPGTFRTKKGAVVDGWCLDCKRGRPTDG